MSNPTNDILFAAYDSDGINLGIINLRVIKNGAEGDLEILANWPRFLQIGQTGFVEFVSSVGQNYQIFYGAGTSNALLDSPFFANSKHSLLAFTIDAPLFVENTNNVPLFLATESGANPTPLPRPITTVSTAGNPDGKGKLTLKDIDGDNIYITFKSKIGNTMKVEGRSIYISGTPDTKAKVSIKVKPAKGVKTSDTVAAIDLVKAPALSGVSMKGGDLDEVICDEGALGYVKVSAGNLGYSNNSWYVKGLIATSDTKIVSIKGKKNKSKQIIGGSIFADILVASGGPKFKGVKIITSGDINGAEIAVPFIKSISAKMNIVNSQISCPGGELKLLSVKNDFVSSSINAGTIKTIKVSGKIEDVKVVAVATDLKKGYSIGKISASSIVDNNNDALNYADRRTKFIAGLEPGAQETNLYNLSETTIGTIISVKTKAELQGLFITKGKYNNKKTSIKTKTPRADTWLVDSVDEKQWTGQ